MKSTEPVDSRNIFNNFEGHIPPIENLSVESSGFLADDTHIYGFRRAGYLPDAQSGSELYNGTMNPGDKRPIFQATEGHGLYIANTPPATHVPGIHGDTMYALRVVKKNNEWLDSHNPPEHQAGQRVAAGLHRLRGSVIGIPNPGPRGWDRLYGTADIVSFPPMALARLIMGRTVQLGENKIKPRWAIIRNPDSVEVIGHYQITK